MTIQPAEELIVETPVTPGPPLLEVSNLEVVYNEVSVAVRGISFTVPDGAIVALLGSNGAGKTSTIRALTGLLPLHDGRIREGEVRFAGENIVGRRTQQLVRSGICQVPEGRMVFEYLTVDENLRMGSATRKDRGVKEDLDRMYDLFPRLRERRRMQAGWLSGGEQQMVAIARALMVRPRLLLVDELSLGLAPLVVQELLHLLQQINAEEGTAVLLIEQNARLALEVAEYAYIMETGLVVLDGPADEVASNEDVQDFYLGGGGDGQRQNYAAVKHYKRRKRWLQ